MNKKKKTILSLDVSSVSTGWSVFVNYKLVSAGIIKIKKVADICEKMVIFRNEILGLLKKYKPTIVLIEDVWIGNNPKTGKVLAKFCGVAEEVVCEHVKHKPVIIENTRVKGFLKCRDKKEVYEFILSLLELDAIKYSYNKDNDITDSIAQVLFYLENELNVKIRTKKPYGYFFDVRRLLNG